MAPTPTIFSDGKGYERLMGRWSRVVGEIFLDWLSPEPDMHWIDVGCGNGAFTELLLERCAPSAVTAIDPSEGQLDFARTRLADAPVTFRQAGGEDLPFDDDSFDAAAMALAINMVPDPATAPREMARVVRPGGLVATYMWDITGGGFPVEPLRVGLAGLGVPTPVFNEDATRIDRLAALWEEAGLDVVVTRRIDIRVAFDDFDDFWDSHMVVPTTFNKAMDVLTPSQMETLRANVRDSLPTDSDGHIAYGAFANAVKGRVPG